MTKPHKPDIWMPLYIADWNDKTRHLTCEQDGAYGRLVRHYWVNGAISDDDTALACIVGLDRAKWRKMRPALATFFHISDGRWFHERVEEELERARQITDARRQSGKLGGRPKKQTVSVSFPFGSENGPISKANGKQNETPTRVVVSTVSDIPCPIQEGTGTRATVEEGTSGAEIIALDGRVRA